LRESGHHLHLLCYGIDGREEDERRDDGVIVRYIQPHKRRWQRRLDNWRFCFLFRNVLWENQITRFVQDFALQALHVHDLPLVGAAYHVAQQFGLPVVADLHENYPSALQYYWKSPWKKAVLYNRKRWQRYECAICTRVDRVLCVIEESRDRLVDLGVPGGKITIIPNACPPEFENSPIDRQIIEQYRDHFVISYIGTISGSHRGVDVAIQAMGHLRKLVPAARLLIVGRVSDLYMPEFQRLVSDPKVSDVVEFAGWRPFEQVPSYILASDVCLVPHNRSVQTDASGPHKLFQYMMLERPVVVSDCCSLKRIAQESGGAAVFRAGDPADLARVLAELYADSARREALGARGHQLALTGAYSWRETQKRLLAIYRALSDSSHMSQPGDA